MTDAGNAIQVDIQSAIISAFEQSNATIRYNLGYISGEFSKNITSENLYVRIWFRRGINLEWENIQFTLNAGRKTFRQKLPAGLTVAEFYAQLYGWVAPTTEEPDLIEFELVDFELSVKEIPIGKFGGEPLGLNTSVEPPPPPEIEEFEMLLDIIGDVQATQARAVWFTTHEATTKVIYGTSPLSMTQEAEDLTFTQYHSIVLTGLEVNRLYYAQFYSISKITGEEIYSDIKSFFTGPELTITNFLDNTEVGLLTKTKTELDITNVIGEADYLLQINPDGLGELNISDVTLETHTKTHIYMTNIIRNEFDTSVT